MAYYAAHNTHTNARNGNRGARNTWEISRFDTKAERDDFVDRYENNDARAVTRREAARIWADCYLCAGKTVPVGGLFAQPEDWVFWNISNDY